MFFFLGALYYVKNLWNLKKKGARLRRFPQGVLTRFTLILLSY